MQGDTEEVIAAKRRKIHAIKNQQKEGLQAQKQVPILPACSTGPKAHVEAMIPTIAVSFAVPAATTVQFALASGKYGSVSHLASRLVYHLFLFHTKQR